MAAFFKVIKNPHNHQAVSPVQKPAPALQLVPAPQPKPVSKSRHIKAKAEPISVVTIAWQKARRGDAPNIRDVGRHGLMNFAKATHDHLLWGMIDRHLQEQQADLRFPVLKHFVDDNEATEHHGWALARLNEMNGGKKPERHFSNPVIDIETLTPASSEKSEERLKREAKLAERKARDRQRHDVISDLPRPGEAPDDYGKSRKKKKK